jgi:hypothetical protein
MFSFLWVPEVSPASGTSYSLLKIPTLNWLNWTTSPLHIAPARTTQKNFSSIIACSHVSGETTCPQGSFIATAFVLCPVYTAVTWQWVYMTHCSLFSLLVPSSLQAFRHFFYSEGTCSDICVLPGAGTSSGSSGTQPSFLLGTVLAVAMGLHVTLC